MLSRKGLQIEKFEIQSILAPPLVNSVEEVMSLERVCIFIDNTNLLHAVHALAEHGQRIDYHFLKRYLASGRSADARFYYSRLPFNVDTEAKRQAEKQKKFLTSIEQLGYAMIGVDPVGVKEGGLELEIAYDMVKFSYQQPCPYSSFILVANDDVYARIIRRLRVDNGMEVDVAFFGCCTALSRAASHYHDLSKVSDSLFRQRRVASFTGVQHT